MLLIDAMEAPMFAVTQNVRQEDRPDKEERSEQDEWREGGAPLDGPPMAC